MKRAGFTMIELIFVIVILGILAAVAVPKMGAVSQQAKIQNMESFVATLNRTVAPTMWASSIADGNGSIQNLNITDFVDLPNGVTVVNLNKCDENWSDLTSSDQALNVSTAALPVAEKIFCKDGNSIEQPVFSFSSDDFNGSVQSN